MVPNTHLWVVLALTAEKQSFSIPNMKGLKYSPDWKEKSEVSLCIMIRVDFELWKITKSNKVMDYQCSPGTGSE